MRIPAALRFAALFATAAFSLTISAANAHADMSAIRIGAIGWSDRAGDANTQFVQLVSTGPAQSRDAELHLEITTALGSQSDLLVSFGAAEGQPWPAAGAWLIAGTSFASKVGLARDGALGRLDPLGGALTLWTYDSTGTRVDLDTITWSTQPGLTRPPYNGQSLQRTSYGFTTQPHPTIMNSAGARVTDTAYGYDPQTMWALAEGFFDCANSTTNARYVQLRSTAPGYFDSHLYLRTTDATGRAIGQFKLFPNVNGVTFSTGTNWLTASAALQTAIGLTPDQALSVLPSAVSGSVDLILPNAIGDSVQVVQTLRYGITNAPELPSKGLALQRQSDGSYLVAMPNPVTRAGLTAASNSCLLQASSAPAWHVREVGLDCSDHVAGLWFISVTPDYIQPMGATLGLRVLDHLGGTLISIPQLGADGHKAGFLVASPAFVTSTGFTPDLVSSGAPDPLGGHVQLTNTVGGVTTVVQELVYGGTPGAVIGLPIAGGSIRFIGTAYSLTTAATPLRSDGAVAQSDCFQTVDASLIRIDQLGLRCVTGTPNTEFIQLRSTTGTSLLDGRSGLRVYDHSGALIGDLRSAFSALKLTLPLGQTFLIGGSRFATTGLTPDLVLPFALDHEGGRLQFYRTRFDTTFIPVCDVDYSGANLPPDGMGLTRLSDASYAISTSPNPHNLAGQSLTSTACYGALANSSYRIDEFGTGCHTTDANFWYITLHAQLESPLYSPPMRLRARDRNGAVLFQTDTLGMQSNGRQFLVGSANFAGLAGFAPDHVIAGAVDTVAGTIEFVRLVSGAEVVQTLITYGSMNTLAAPPAGGSLHWDGSSWSTRAAATPTRADGTTTTLSCGPPSTALRISEVGLQCHGGTAGRSFLELQAVGSDASLDGRLRIQWFDSRGQLTGDLASVLANSAGLVIPAGRYLLFAPSGFSALGPTPDLTLPFQPDTLGGRVLMTGARSDGTTQTLSDVRYGTLGTPITAGRSLTLDSRSNYSQSYASPRNLGGTTLTSAACYDTPPPATWMVEELGTRCASSAPASFLQLGTLVANDVTTELGLLVQDSTGRTIADVPRFFAPLAGLHMVPGQHLLIAGAAFTSYPGGHTDLALPVELDPRAGAVVIYRDPQGNAAQRTWVATLPYGVSPTSAPPPGQALVQSAPGVTSLISRVVPVDLSGTPRLTHCYVPRDTSVRIFEIATGCYGGTTGYGYVALTSLSKGSYVEPGLGLRIFDGQGRLLEDHPITSSALVGQPWKHPEYELANRLFATPAFAGQWYYPVDDTVRIAPPADSGAVELYYHDPETDAVTVLDRKEYGSMGHIAAPRRGEALRRGADGALVSQAYQAPYGPHLSMSCAEPSLYGFDFRQIVLQCTDGSLGGQFIEMLVSSQRVFDPNVGITATDHAGHVLFDRRDLFGALTWTNSPTDAAFLLAPAEAAARVGVSPDFTLPAPLDTSGGSVTIYLLASNGDRRTIRTLTYGGSSILPPPGCGLITVNGSFAQNAPTGDRFPSSPWPLTGCTMALPAVQLSQVSRGCSFEPGDAGGGFVELRALAQTTLTGVFQLEIQPFSPVTILTNPAKRSFVGGQNWLVAPSAFAALSGLTPDETPWTGLRASVYDVRLLWSPGPHYAPLPIDQLSAGSNGQSVQRTPNGTIVVGAADPHNAAGQGLTPNSCFSNGVISPPMVVYSFSPGCHAGGSASAFVMLYWNSVDAADMRLKITAHDGSTLCDLPALFGGTGPPSSSSGLWLIGAIGFEAGAAYRPDIELPIRFDPSGGEVTLYRSQASGVDYISSRIRYPALDFGQGMQRADFFSSYPAPVPLLTSVLPKARRDPDSRTVWTNFGDFYGQNTRLMSAGSICPDGSTTSDFAELSFPLDVPSSCQYLPSTCRPYAAPPRGGWLRSLDNQGAPLDSVQLFTSSVREISTAGLGGTFARVLYSAIGVAAEAEKLPADRAPRMDRLGGTLQFVMMRPDGKPAEVASVVRYGSVAGTPNTSGAFFGSPPRVSGCSPCGTHAFALGAGKPFVHSTQPQFHWADAPAGSGGTGTQVTIEGASARTTIASASGAPISLLTSTEFRLNGAASSAPITVHARLLVQGSLTWRNVVASAEGADLLVTLDGDHPSWQHRQWTSSTAAGPQDIRDTVDVFVTVTPDTPFRLGLIYRNGAADFSSTSFSANWAFTDLPPGVTVTSCHGYGGAPVPTALALSNAQAFDDHIDLDWLGGESALRYTLERQFVTSDGSSSAWLPLATLVADGDSRLSYRDASVRPGATYAYRLRSSDGHVTAETRVSVPDPARLSLAIVGAQPVHGALEFAVTRPGAAAARLEVFDIAGRLISHREFAAGGDVRQRVGLDTGTAHAGVFLARLRCGGDARTVRVVRVP